MGKMHTPVLLDLATDFLVNNQEGVYVDCTLGTGGHFSEIARKTNQEAFLIGFDADESAIDFCKNNLDINQEYILVNSNFEYLKKYCYRNGFPEVNGILMDLGLSSFALDNPERGFSYDQDGPLDMRFSKAQDLTAQKFINSASRNKLHEVFKNYGEVKKTPAIVNGILDFRKNKRIKRTSELKQIIKNRTPYKYRKKVLSQVFQAIRIHINQELDVLKSALEQSMDLLVPEGRLVVISYHSLEDRIVKHFFKEKAKDCICPPEFPICQCEHTAEVEILTDSPVVPDEEEIDKNPRSRSAKLRAIEKL